MYTKQNPFFLIARTPVHPGSGSDLGVIDLPIQRERHTGFPKIEASGIKGVFREYFRNTEMAGQDSLISLLFGPEQGDAHQSAIGFIDARTLFFPVKSVKGVFAWITCPDVLAKFQETVHFSGGTIEDAEGVIDLAGLRNNTVTQNSTVCVTRGNSDDPALSVVLEEYPQAVSKDPLLTRFADWFSDHVLIDPELGYQKQKFPTSLVVINPDMFTRFVRHATEVIARTRIDSDKGTVQKGALWYEEYLPVETIMYSTLLSCQPMMSYKDQKEMFKDLEASDKTLFDEIMSLHKNAGKVMDQITDRFPPIIQLGGNATLGKGFMKPVLLPLAENENREESHA